MSTGSELLRRLVQQKSSQRHRKLKSHDAGVDCVDAAATGAKRAAVVGTNAPTSLVTSTIEVCLGPDCIGQGSGATFLEIEDLISGRRSSRAGRCNENQDIASVVPGGCRDFCTMGPNVMVRRGPDGETQQHSRVNDPEACRSIVASVYGEQSGGSATPPLTPTAALMKRREDGIRWRSLRQRAAMERRLMAREREKSSA